ncbi:unnamed protein product [Hapterophycus canaliculatus]
MVNTQNNNAPRLDAILAHQMPPYVCLKLRIGADARSASTRLTWVIRPHTSRRQLPRRSSAVGQHSNRVHASSTSVRLCQPRPHRYVMAEGPGSHRQMLNRHPNLHR